MSGTEEGSEASDAATTDGASKESTDKAGAKAAKAGTESAKAGAQAHAETADEQAQADEPDEAKRSSKPDPAKKSGKRDQAKKSAGAGKEMPPEEEYPYTGPPRFEGWRKRSATGAMLTGFAFGLREVFEAPREDPPIMMEASGEPPRDLPVDAEVGEIRPMDNVVKIRPWLLEGEQSDRTESSSAAKDTPAAKDMSAEEKRSTAKDKS